MNDITLSPHLSARCVVFHFFLQTIPTTNDNALINSSGSHTKNTINVDRMDINLTFSLNLFQSILLRKYIKIPKKNSNSIKFRLNRALEKFDFVLSLYPRNYDFQKNLHLQCT